MEYLQVFSLIGQALSAAWGWFAQIWDRSGALSVFLAAIFTFQVYRFFLAPLLAFSNGSDQAKKSGKKDM